jgi:hypothetical protein
MKLSENSDFSTYEELVHDCTLTELCNANEPPFRDDVDGRNQRKKWNRDQKRLNAMHHDGVYRVDDARLLRLTCYKKYGVGRRIMAFPSLQACPKIHRGPLAYRCQGGGWVFRVCGRRVGTTAPYSTAKRGTGAQNGLLVDGIPIEMANAMV